MEGFEVILLIASILFIVGYFYRTLWMGFLFVIIIFWVPIKEMMEPYLQIVFGGIREGKVEEMTLSHMALFLVTIGLGLGVESIHTSSAIGGYWIGTLTTYTLIFVGRKFYNYFI